MKRTSIFLLAFVTVISIPLHSQITLDWCQEKARGQYPLISMSALIEDAKQYTLRASNTSYLPRVTVSGKVTYQSEVTELPISIPGIAVDSLSKDQYQILTEINQTIWDGGVTGSKNKISSLSAETDRQKVEVELYALRDRVNQIFFGILLLDRQLEQNALLTRELEINHGRLRSYRANGVASSSDVDAVGVEILNTGQTRIELFSARKAYRDMLSRMTGTTIDDSVSLLQPSSEISEADVENGLRPEMQMYASQEKLNGAQKEMLIAGVLPKLSAFLQTGYGKPGLNMLSNDFTTFYIAGVRVSWALDGFYSLKADIDRFDANAKMIALQRDTFVYNMSLKTIQQKNEISKLQELIQSDSEIIALRNGMKRAAETKLENGTVSVNDLLREISAENLAVQKKALHEIQLLLSIYNYKFTLNN